MGLRSMLTGIVIRLLAVWLSGDRPLTPSITALSRFVSQLRPDSAGKSTGLCGFPRLCRVDDFPITFPIRDTA